MHTAIPLVFGALTGWVVALSVRAGDWAHIVSYVAMSAAGASIGSWLIDAIALVSGRGVELHLKWRIILSFSGSVLLILGFRLMR